MERWCGQATGVVKVESKSMAGVSIVRLYFRDDIDPAAALTEVNSLALSTLQTLPPGTLPPIVRPFDPTATLPLCILSVSSPDGRLGRGRAARPGPRRPAQPARRSAGRGRPDGLRRPRAGRHGLRSARRHGGPATSPPLDVVRSLRNYNAMLAAGTAKFGDEEVQLDSNALVLNVEDFNDVPVKIVDDKQVYLQGRRRGPRTPAASRPPWCASTAGRRSTCPSTASRGPAAWPSSTASRRRCR